jgi:hypothetical protein
MTKTIVFCSGGGRRARTRAVRDRSGAATRGLLSLSASIETGRPGETHRDTDEACYTLIKRDVAAEVAKVKEQLKRK